MANIKTILFPMCLYSFTVVICYHCDAIFLCNEITDHRCCQSFVLKFYWLFGMYLILFCNLLGNKTIMQWNPESNTLKWIEYKYALHNLTCDITSLTRFIISRNFISLISKIWEFILRSCLKSDNFLTCIYDNFCLQFYNGSKPYGLKV